MANVSAARMSTGISGVEIVLYYNDTNNRISDVAWSVPANVEVHVRIWDSNVSSIDPVIDRIEVEGSGSQLVAGNYAMVDDPSEGLILPPNISCVFTSQGVMP